MDTTFLRSERLQLRPLEAEDAMLLAACNNSPEVRASFFTHTPTNPAAQRDLIGRLYGKGADYLPLAIMVQDTGEAIGVTAYHRLDLVSRAAVFSLCIASQEHWGRGLATEATEAMLAYGFDILGLHRVQLHVWADNGAAISIYRKCGFVEEGRLREAMQHHGVFCDFLVMGLLEREWRALRP